MSIQTKPLNSYEGRELADILSTARYFTRSLNDAESELNEINEKVEYCRSTVAKEITMGSVLFGNSVKTVIWNCFSFIFLSAVAFLPSILLLRNPDTLFGEAIRIDALSITLTTYGELGSFLLICAGAYVLAVVIAIALVAKWRFRRDKKEQQKAILEKSSLEQRQAAAEAAYKKLKAEFYASPASLVPRKYRETYILSVMEEYLLDMAVNTWPECIKKWEDNAHKEEMKRLAEETRETARRAARSAEFAAWNSMQK